MAKGKGGLGRGLDSLFGDAPVNFEPVSVSAPKTKAAAKPAAKKTEEKEKGERVEYIRISDIKPNSKQPRKVFSEELIEELSESIKEHGLIQPIIVRPAAKGYELVAGERRWRAARKAGLKEIPAIVRELTEKQNAFYALIENMQREDLNAIEEAMGINEIMTGFNLNQEETASAIGKSRSYVANALRLLGLPEEVQNYVLNKELSAGHARAIAGLKTEELQKEAAAKAVKEGWSVRQIEQYTGTVAKKKPTKRKTSKDAAVRDVEERLGAALGTRVNIKGSEKRGSVVIEYYSRAELDRILETLEK